MSELTAGEAQIRATRQQPLFTISADRGWSQRFGLAAEDLAQGFALRRLAFALGMSDIRLRYRGSALGPFWLTLSTAIMIGAMGFLYADLFHTNIHTYLPYLAVSLVMWNYLNQLITEGCTCFTAADSLIKGTRMPFTVHVARSVIRNTIVLGHNLIVIVVVFLVMGVHVSLSTLLAIPAFCLWLVDAFAIAFLLGSFCARFRDVPQIVASVLQIAFFVTPIMWNAQILGHSGRIVPLLRFNPFLYMIEIIRAPLLGTALPLSTIGGALVVSAIILLVSGLAFAKTRGRIAYWM
jgi:lipopolysaccharide transport system permease protein